MKAFLGVALMVVRLFAPDETSAMPYCAGGTFKDGHFVCTSIHDNQ